MTTNLKKLSEILEDELENIFQGLENNLRAYKNLVGPGHPRASARH